jgi:hypothetical protein
MRPVPHSGVENFRKSLFPSLPQDADAKETGNPRIFANGALLTDE